MLRPVHDCDAPTMVAVQAHRTSLEEQNMHAPTMHEKEGTYVLWDFSAQKSTPVQPTRNNAHKPTMRAAKRLRNR
jgi:hypothetical protein